MKALFADLLKVEGVKGVILLSFEGSVLFEYFLSVPPDRLDSGEWRSFLETLEGVREADLVFENGRIYVRRTHQGFLILWVGLFASMAMLRLNCDILLPMLKPTKTSKGFKRFFRKK